MTSASNPLKSVNDRKKYIFQFEGLVIPVPNSKMLSFFSSHQSSLLQFNFSINFPLESHNFIPVVVLQHQLTFHRSPDSCVTSSRWRQPHEDQTTASTTPYYPDRCLKVFTLFIPFIVFTIQTCIGTSPSPQTMKTDGTCPRARRDMTLLTVMALHCCKRCGAWVYVIIFIRCSRCSSLHYSRAIISLTIY